MNRSCYLLGCLLICGCTNQSDEPANPTIDFSKGRKTHTVDVSDLKFPEGFPNDIQLLEPTQIYEQQMETDAITWDTEASAEKARDYYLAEFKKLNLETFVFEPKDMPGKNYEIRAWGKDRSVYYGIGIGKQRPESSVSCFIFSNKSTESDWNKAD